MASTSMSVGSGVRSMREPRGVKAGKGTTGFVWNAHMLSEAYWNCLRVRLSRTTSEYKYSRDSSIHRGVCIAAGVYPNSHILDHGAATLPLQTKAR
jgi:hypothetical protein